jgi:pimeloyl-ACP methyl ester carboxylesterase
VWIHGYSGSAFETYYIKDHIEPPRRLIAPDLPGSGYSDKPNVDYTLDYYVRFLSEFIDQLELERYVLVGHSMGGMIASAYASGDPEGLERLVLIAPYGLEGEAGAVLEFLAGSGVLVDVGMELHNETVLEIGMRANVFHDPSRIPEDLVDYLAVSTFHTENAVKALTSITHNMIAKDHDESMLDRIEVPTLIIWGSDDGILDFDHSAVFNRRIKDSSLQAIPDCGHLPHVELPVVTGEIMSRFLALRTEGER